MARCPERDKATFRHGSLAHHLESKAAAASSAISSASTAAPSSTPTSAASASAEEDATRLWHLRRAQLRHDGAQTAQLLRAEPAQDG